MTLDPSSIPFGSRTLPREPRKGILWKWSIAVTLAGLGFLIWQCGSTLLTARDLSYVAVQQFHGLLNEERYEQIFLNADNGFQRSANKEQTLKFLQTVHRKLGRVEQASLANITVQTITGSNYIVGSYTTKFERGEALEKFTWTKKDGQLRLYGYNVQSKVLIE